MKDHKNKIHKYSDEKYRIKETIQSDLMDPSLERIDDASDFMSPTYGSVKGDDVKIRFVSPGMLDKNKNRSTSTFYPGKANEDNIIPAVNDDAQMTVMYNAMLTKAEQDPKILYFLKNFIREKGETVDDENFTPQYELFVEFMKDFRKTHQRCGENCNHLQRFYARIGFYHIWNKRSPLAMKKPAIVSNMARTKAGMKLPNIPDKKVLKMAS